MRGGVAGGTVGGGCAGSASCWASFAQAGAVDESSWLAEQASRLNEAQLATSNQRSAGLASSRCGFQHKRQHAVTRSATELEIIGRIAT